MKNLRSPRVADEALDGFSPVVPASSRNDFIGACTVGRVIGPAAWDVGGRPEGGGERAEGPWSVVALLRNTSGGVFNVTPGQEGDERAKEANFSHEQKGL